MTGRHQGLHRAPPTTTQPPAAPRLVRLHELGILVAITVAPLLVGARGRVNADTKQYLYLDPDGLLARAFALWDPDVAGGAVTHQTIGYLWPMGPFYWLTNAVGMPDWAAQRLWIGGLQLIAGAGALLLFRTVLPARPLQLVAAAGYALSPVVLGHVVGQSALLLPFTFLPLLVWCLVRGIDDPDWRWPAGFALLVTTAGAVNGSSIFFVLLGSVLWVPYAAAVFGGNRWRSGLVLLVRAGGLTVLGQIWWLAAYAIGGRYGLPILALTETVDATSSTASAGELIRGLGYWFFYGGDAHRPWLDGLAPPYMTSPAVIICTFAVPAIALWLSSRILWSIRGYFAGLAALGMLIATVAYSSPERSPVGGLFEAASRRSDLVLSLRNTQRAGPLVALGLMGLLAGGLTALEVRRPRRVYLAGAMAAVAIVGALPAQWTTGLIGDRFHRDEDLPQAWHDAAEQLEAGEGNVLELPGIDFASYRWGHTLDPVSIGLTDRPVIARELVPQGSPVGVSLLNALDRSFQEGWYEAAALAPMARLLGASTILDRNDLEYERYRTVRPSRVWDALTNPLAGLDPPSTFDSGVPNRAVSGRPLIDEIELGFGLKPPQAPPSIALFDVPDGDRTPMATAAPGSPVIVEGSGEGFYAAAAAGLLDREAGPVLLGADLARPDTPDELFGDKARWIITDSNRKQDERWYSLRENVGATEPPDAEITTRAIVDGRIPLVPDQPSDARTTVHYEGARRIWATDYGSAITLTPEDRPSNAFDGDPRTAWRIDPGTIPGQRLIGIELSSPASPSHVTLIEPQGRPATSAITRATVILDGTREFPVRIGRAAAFDPDGHDVALDGDPFTTLEVRIDGLDDYTGPAGFGEITIPGVEVREVVDLPGAMLRRLGTALDSVPAAIVISRLRADPSEPVRSDPELWLERAFELPVASPFELVGTVRLRPDIDPALLDDLLGASGGPVRARQSLPGSIASRASAALDGDPTTAWTTPFVGVAGQWWEATAGNDLTVSSVVVDIVVDERHSTPTAIEVIVDDGPPVLLPLPDLEPGPLGTVRSVRLDLPEPRRGRTVRLTLDRVDERTTPDWYSGGPIELPAAITEIRIPGLEAVVPGSTVDTGCRTDLLEIDGDPVPVRITGTSAAAIRRDGLELRTCDGAPLELSAGPHRLSTVPGLDTGLDLDRLVLRTAGWDQSPTTAASPPVEVRHTGRGVLEGTLDGDGEPYWLIVDQSANDGWQLHLGGPGGEGAQIDGPHPVDGNAVGWFVTPAHAGATTVEAIWGPQRVERLALGLSAATVLACVVLVGLGWRRSARVVRRYSPPRIVRKRDHTVRQALPGALLLGGLVALFLNPLLAPAVVAFQVVADARPRWGRLAPAALVTIGALFVLVGQLRHGHRPGPGWPHNFDATHALVMVATLMLAVETITELQRRQTLKTRRREARHLKRE
ncbi:MAG: DUF3367 domain-containing protein [Actinomycetota bacterium]|nr:DUF3367 domain-containing protein [Actinomycetota bacterium]